MHEYHQPLLLAKVGEPGSRYECKFATIFYRPLVDVLQVTFHLNADNVLSVEAKDLNTGRHHLWKSGGGAIIAQGIDKEKLQNGVVPFPAQNAIPVA